jgi:DNA-binding transcriptional ArsR family regulator
MARKDDGPELGPAIRDAVRADMKAGMDQLRSEMDQLATDMAALQQDLRSELADLPAPAGRLVTEAAVLRAVAHPLRRRLLDVLHVDGPSTASTLAEATDQAVGNVSHHLKVLHQAGFIEEVPELAKDRRERWWRSARRNWAWSQSHVDEGPAGAEVARSTTALEIQRQFDKALAWLDAPADVRARWADADFVSSSWLKLTPEELAEFGEELFALVRRWSDRDRPDGPGRESVFFFAHAVPSRP